MVADARTKSLPSPVFIRHRHVMISLTCVALVIETCDFSFNDFPSNIFKKKIEGKFVQVALLVHNCAPLNPSL